MAQWRLLRCRAMLAQARGSYADAYRLGAEALGTMAATGFPPAFMMWGGLLSVQCHHTGQTSESLGTAGITDADATLQDWPLSGVIPTLAPASMLADAGRLREAASVFRRLGPVSEWQESPHAMLFTWAIGLATAQAVGADEDVAALRSKLGPWRGHHVVNGRYAMAYGGPVELHLGRAAAYLGLVDDAIADLEHAVKACTDNGAQGYRAEAEYELASALVHRSRPGDHVRARTVVIEALRRADELDMQPIRARAKELLERIDTRHRGGADAPRATGRGPGRAGYDEPRDRVAAVPVRAHRAEPRPAHPQQAGPAEPEPDRALGARAETE